jgi:hypothetical protein
MLKLAEMCPPVIGLRHCLWADGWPGFDLVIRKGAKEKQGKAKEKQGKAKEKQGKTKEKQRKAKDLFSFLEKYADFFCR